MLYRNVPKTGDELSILGFGTMRLPEKDGTIDREKATALIRHAIDRGVNYIDTAWTYHSGQSETVVGEALAGAYRNRVRIATKMPRWLVTTREDMDRFLDLQLQRLRTDHIDYYLVHSLLAGNWRALMELGLAEFLDAAQADGRIINAGFSFHDDTETFKEIVDAYDWDFCQIQYNYLDEYHQAGTEGLRYAAERGLAVMIMEPLRGGNLAVRVPPEVSTIWDEAEKKRTPAAWGLRWIWNHPEVTVVLSGMNEISQVDENIETASEGRAGSLTADELAIVRRAADTFQALMSVPCTGCRYCMPCPNGVDIPGCFDLYNSAHLFGDQGPYNDRYFYSSLHRPQKNSGASLCRDCGLCEDQCLQHIEIRKHLKTIEREFEGTG
jgi:predicted aldo/keto reductase-like oxidoreductase